MHELGIAQDLFHIVEDKAKENNLKAVTKIVVVVGEASGIEEDFLRHNLSLNLVAKYLQKETFADVFLLGIQPKTTEFGREISRPVREGLEKIVRMLERT